MCLGLAILDVIYFGIAGSTGTQTRSPSFRCSTLVIAFNMALPMVAWMRFRGHEWAPIWEMSAAMFVEAIVLIGALWLELVSAGTSLSGWQHALMAPAMIIPMLFRLDLYTGRGGHKAPSTETAFGCATVGPLS